MSTRYPTVAEKIRRLIGKSITSVETCSGDGGDPSCDECNRIAIKFDGGATLLIESSSAGYGGETTMDVSIEEPLPCSPAASS